MAQHKPQYQRNESMNDEYVFDIVCDVCESTCEVIVDDKVGAPPEFCPMCGSPVLEQ
jgi:rRNA maturation endonuclease Nob1